jgi:deazaflavin-dependent oxidoreductase (nitroreductase family)
MPKKLPPRWFIRCAWVLHRVLLRVIGDRRGLRRPRPDGRFGMLRLHTVGRRSAQPRAVVLGYLEDGDRLVTLAMNGWDPAEPAWWLNLQARPDTTVDLVGGSRPVTAYRADGAERERLWHTVRESAGYGDLDTFARLRGRETAVVVLRPRRGGSTT